VNTSQRGEENTMAVDPHRVILIGENPSIRLGIRDGDPFTTAASYCES
jgi:hypothetical protein